FDLGGHIHSFLEGNSINGLVRAARVRGIVIEVHSSVGRCGSSEFLEHSVVGILSNMRWGAITDLVLVSFLQQGALRRIVAGVEFLHLITVSLSHLRKLTLSPTVLLFSNLQPAFCFVQ